METSQKYFILIVFAFLHIYDVCVANVSLVINFLILILNPFFNLIPFQVKWQARPISISKNTTDPNYMDLNVKIERFGQGEFAFTGTYFTTIEMDESVTVRSS